MAHGFRRQSVTHKVNVVGAPTPGNIVVSTNAISANVYQNDTVPTQVTFDVTASGGQLNGPAASIAYVSGSGWLTAVVQQVGSGWTCYCTITPGAAAAGSYVANVTVSDTADATPEVVQITMVVAVAKATMAISVPAYSGFTCTVGGTTSTPATYDVTISNAASIGSLAGPVVASNTVSTWLGTAVTSLGGGAYRLRLTPNTNISALAQGVTSGVITLTDTGASNSVQLSVGITANAVVLQPVLAIDSNYQDRAYTIGGGTPGNRSTGLRRTDGGVLVGPTIVSGPTFGGNGTGWATPTITGNTLGVVFNTAQLPTAAGVGYMDVVIGDASASNTVNYRLELTTNGAVAQVQIVTSPSTIGVTSVFGINAATTSFSVTSSITTALTGVTASIVGGNPAWISSVTYSGGLVTVVFNSAATAVGPYNATIRITASNAVNSPVDVPLTLWVQSSSVTTYPSYIMSGPRTAALPNGFRWDSAVAYPRGSIFNTLAGYRQADDGAMPAFAGTVYNVASAGNWTTVSALIANGTVVDGDVISVAKGLNLANVQLPVRGGHTYGTNGFIQIRSTGHTNLPTYSYNNGPASYDAAHCVSLGTHEAEMAYFSTTVTNRSCVMFQTGAGGYWLTGICFYMQNTAATHTMVNVVAHNGTSTVSQTNVAMCPHTIVFDRCAWKADGQWFLTLQNHGKHVAVRHCDMGFAYQSNAIENKGILIINTPGAQEYLGNKYAAWGICMLTGGAVPTISQIVPSDVMNAWNNIQLPRSQVLTILNGTDGDECKNALEHKTGKRYFHGFNDIRNLGWRFDQSYAFLVKATDQASSGLYQAKNEDICYWANYVHGSKGFFGMADIYAGTTPTSPNPGGAALGCERIEVRFNLHVYEPGLCRPADGVAASAAKQKAAALNPSQGDGVPDADICHNTWGGRQAMWNYDLAPPSTGWRNVRLNDNIHIDGSTYGPVFSSNGTNAAANDRMFGAGNWEMKRSYVLQGSAAWGATMTSAPWQCGTFASSVQTAIFTDPTNRNFKLLPGVVGKGLASEGDGSDPGYNRDYLAAMIPDGGF